jgi:hypothetical protein
MSLYYVEERAGNFPWARPLDWLLVPVHGKPAGTPTKEPLREPIFRENFYRALAGLETTPSEKGTSGQPTEKPFGLKRYFRKV